MKLDYLGAVGRLEPRHAFLVSLGNGLNDIRDSKKKVVLIGGICDAYFKVETLLREKGILVSAYADSSQVLNGKMFGTKVVSSSYDLFEKDEYYPIIVGAMPRINNVRIQLMIQGVTQYSFYLESAYHNFQNEDASLSMNVMALVNMLSFENETVQSALPWIDNVQNIGNYEAVFSHITGLLASTTWSHWIYSWANKYLREISEKRILEIGPGYGVLSGVLLETYPDAKIDWVLFGTLECQGSEHELAFDQDVFPNALEENLEGTAYLKKLRERYSGRTRAFVGMIERSAYKQVEQQYELIIMTEVFEHFAVNPIETMRKIHDLLSDEGYMLFSTPNLGHIHIYKTWKEMPRNEELKEEEYVRRVKIGHNYQYNINELNEIFNESGWEIVQYALSDGNSHNCILRKNSSKA